MNFAGVRRLPMVFICDNNQWAYSTPTHLEYATEHVADRAEAYGFEGVVVDGTDVLAVYREAKRAIEKARDGGGPTLIECVTLRMEGHAVHDDAFYVPKEMFEEWAENDPIERFRTWLRENADMTDDEEDEIAAGVKKLLNDALKRAEESPLPDPSDAHRGRLRDARGPRHAAPQVMAELTYLQAISDGLRTEMRRDKRVFVIGEDVGVYGGAFKVTLGFQEEFGPWRVIDAPLAETAIVGGCTGAAIMGMRPVAEMQFADFISCAWDHLVTVAAKQRYRAGTPVPIAVRLPSGGGFSGGPFHSQNPESSFAHIPGLKCVCPATPEDAKGLLISAIEDPNPVLYFEHKHLYRRIKGEVPEERYTTPLGKARTHREGDDVSVITWGAMVYTAEEAAQQLESDGVSVEIVDLRTVMPVGQGGGARVRAQDVEGARAARGHAHGRLRRRDRGDDRRGGVRGPRRAGEAHRRARHARAVLAAAREGIHPAGRRRRRRPARARGVLRREHGHHGSHRRRHAADGRVRLGGHDHEVAQAAG